MPARRKRRKKFHFTPSAVFVVIIIALIYFIIANTFFKPKHDEGGFSPKEKQDAKIYEESLKLHFIDVGQGDSALIESPDGKFMLIDAGTPMSGQKICDYLKRQKVKELEYVVFTHPHEDHIGSGVKVLDSFNVKNVMMTQKQANTATYERLIDKLIECKENKGTKIISPKSRDVYEFGKAGIEVLSADSGNSDANNSSIVFRLTYGKCSFMFTGDAEKEIENEILRSGAELNCVLLKCGHHGSSTSTSEKFLEAVNPGCAIISCETDNSYGHPHVETLEKLYEKNVAVYRTDEMGDIVMYCDGKYLYFGGTSKNN